MGRLAYGLFAVGAVPNLDDEVAKFVLGRLADAPEDDNANLVTTLARLSELCGREKVLEELLRRASQASASATWTTAFCGAPRPRNYVRASRGRNSTRGRPVLVAKGERSGRPFFSALQFRGAAEDGGESERGSRHELCVVASQFPPLEQRQDTACLRC